MIQVGKFFFEETTARVLYHQQIGWSYMNGESQGPLNVVTAAREVRVDALRGQLFWTTPHALLMSTLSGRNVTTIHQEGIFSGKQGIKNYFALLNRTGRAPLMFRFFLASYFRLEFELSLSQIFEAIRYCSANALIM